MRNVGFILVGWTVDSGDWLTGVTTQQIVETVTGRLCPGAIVVMHGSRDYNRAAIPGILDYLEQEGYEAVTLLELLAPENGRHRWSGGVFSVVQEFLATS